jgi:hypothetical protein
MSESGKPQLNPPGKETVYIDVEDEITSIIDKVEASKSKIVVLMLPKRATTLQSVVNMRLLKRSADHAKKNLVLVTNESALLPLAGAAGIHVARDLKSAPTIPDSPLVQDDATEPPLPAEGDEDEPDGQPAKLDYKRSIGELAAAAPDTKNRRRESQVQTKIKSAELRALQANAVWRFRRPNRADCIPIHGYFRTAESHDRYQYNQHAYLCQPDIKCLG